MEGRETFLFFRNIQQDVLLINKGGTNRFFLPLCIIIAPFPIMGVSEEKEVIVMQRKKGKRGFTLVELLIVIGISGILMAMSAPKYQGMVEKANAMEQRAHIREALNYIDIYNLETTVKIAEDTKLSAVTIESGDFTAVIGKISVENQSKSISILRLMGEGLSK